MHRVGKETQMSKCGETKPSLLTNTCQSRDQSWRVRLYLNSYLESQIVVQLAVGIVRRDLGSIGRVGWQAKGREKISVYENA